MYFDGVSGVPQLSLDTVGFLVSAIFSAPLHKNRAHRLVSIRSDAVLYSLFSCDCGNGCFDKLGFE